MLFRGGQLFYRAFGLRRREHFRPFVWYTAYSTPNALDLQQCSTAALEHLCGRCSARKPNTNTQEVQPARYDTGEQVFPEFLQQAVTTTERSCKYSRCLRSDLQTCNWYMVGKQGSGTGIGCRASPPERILTQAKRTAVIPVPTPILPDRKNAWFHSRGQRRKSAKQTLLIAPLLQSRVEMEVFSRRLNPAGIAVDARSKKK